VSPAQFVRQNVQLSEDKPRGKRDLVRLAPGSTSSAFLDREGDLVPPVPGGKPGT